MAKTYNGGQCRVDTQGVYRIAIQYCNGREWLTMQPGKETSGPTKNVVLGNSIACLIAAALRRKLNSNRSCYANLQLSRTIKAIVNLLAVF